ncbi:uncharacterized protein LOC144138728 [Haemaphysalis longicornis]
MALLVFIIATGIILPGLVSAVSSPECLRVSVTNFLDIGTCLANKADLCSSSSVGVPALLEKLLECLFKGLAKLDVADQIVILEQFFFYALERVTNGVANDIFEGLCETLRVIVATLTAGIIQMDCGKLKLKKKIICDDPIKIGVPATLGIGDCAGKLGEVCFKGQVMTTSSLESIFRYVDCLLSYLSKTDPEGAFVKVACFLINLPANLLGDALGKPISKSLQEALHVTCP